MGSLHAARISLLAIIAGIVVTACSTPGPTAALDSGPALGSPPAVAPADLDDSVRFRTVFGLRYDEDWIRSVAGDPASDEGRRTFGVPLLPSEVEAVLAQNLAAKDVAAIVSRYGVAVADDWAGMYIDQSAGGTVIVRFKANVTAHERALLALLPPRSKVDVRRAAWSDVELRNFMANVEAERDWFATIGTSFVMAEIEGLHHLVHVRFSGQDPGAARAIEAHFGNPPWLRAVWDGPGDWTGPRGGLLVMTIDSAGRPAADITVFLRSQDILVPNAEEAWTTDADGRLALTDLPAVTYVVRAVEKVGEVLTTIGEARVRVPAGDRGSATVTIVRP